MKNPQPENGNFRSESKLKRHIEIIHERSKPSKLKPHGCNKCKGTYKTKLSLKKHIKIHDNLVVENVRQLLD